MQENVCISCRRSKIGSPCELCQEYVCQDCAQILDAETFSFLKKIPEELSCFRYCQTCYDSKVDPALISYNEIKERAKNLFVFFTTQRKPVPLIRRSKEVMKVEACDDRDETILRLAFFAAEQGFNAIIETEVVAETVRNAGFQHKRWRGSAVPAQVDEEKMHRYR